MIDKEKVEQQIIGTLKTVYDPEIPVDVYELGLIYVIDIEDDGNVKIEMTLTAPGCPVAGDLVEEVTRKVEAIEGIQKVDVDIVWSPPWNKDMMSLDAKYKLGFI